MNTIWKSEVTYRDKTFIVSTIRRRYVTAEGETHEELSKALNDFHTKLSSEQVDMPPEFAEALNDNFLDLLV